MPPHEPVVGVTVRATSKPRRRTVRPVGCRSAFGAGPSRRYLRDSQVEFDLVLFDEASQMRTEHAVGAMAMSRQVAVASAMQLRPTSHCKLYVA